jgi:predicted metal-binding protein
MPHKDKYVKSFVMKNHVKIGIIICDRYSDCAGGKCFRALQRREGAFSIYGKDAVLEVVGYTTCGGCPGGNIEYAPAELLKNGADVVHLATGLLVGYPPCPRIRHFSDFIECQYGLKVVAGTHPIPEKYFINHTQMKTWSEPWWDELLKATLTDVKTRIAYD